MNRDVTQNHGLHSPLQYVPACDCRYWQNSRVYSVWIADNRTRNLPKMNGDIVSCRRAHSSPSLWWSGLWNVFFYLIRGMGSIRVDNIITGRQKQARRDLLCNEGLAGVSWLKASNFKFKSSTVNTNRCNYTTLNSTFERCKHRLLVEHYWLRISHHQMAMTGKVMSLKWSPNKIHLVIN
jgi:hypothetical protein